jgi:8-oxo-dGTP pyrophosphatase MutT (NUDIX family)
VRPGPPPPWPPLDRVTIDDLQAGLERRGLPPERPERVPRLELPGRSWRPAAVLCALFDEDGQAHTVLTRRSSRLKSHTGEVSFPGGRLNPGEQPLDAALRESREEVGLDPGTVTIIGQLGTLSTVANPAPILPFVARLPGRPPLHPNPAEVERAFSVPLVELMQPGVYHEEIWAFPDDIERSIYFFELVGDTVWGATARMLRELLDLLTVLGQSG